MNEAEWIGAAAHYATRIRAAEEVVQKLEELAHFGTTRVPPATLEKLRNDVAPLRRQRERIERGEFRVAVVGLEKAGKSTFINAWLRCDLLPSAQKRCTFTTTQVHSCQKGEERVEISVKRVAELEAMRTELESRIAQNGDKGAREDLDNVQSHWSELMRVVQEGDRRVSFVRLEEIRDLLRDFVASASKAYAVREVRVFTSSLVRASGVVFFDVPGLNSGMARHLEESRAMLADCDAVICIQHARKPSLEAHEKELVRFVKEGDREVGAGGKVFVFAGQIDLVMNRQPLEENLAEIRRQWADHGVPGERVVTGSAAGYLLLTGAAGDVVIQSAAKREQTEARLLELVPDQDPLAACGIDHIRGVVDNYVHKERIVALAKRCDEPIRRILDTARAEYQRVAATFPEDPRLAQREQERRRTIDFNNWWDGQWERIRAATNLLFEDALQTPQENSSALRQRFLTELESRLGSIRAIQQDERQRTFDAARYPAFDAYNTGVKWRKKIFDELIALVEKELAEALSVEISKELLELSRRLEALMWESGEVTRRLVGDLQERGSSLDAEVGLRTLFVRFARPIARALILAPVGSDMRSNIVRGLDADMDLVDVYYRGSDEAFRVFRKFAKFGRALLEDPAVRHVVLGVLPPGASLVAELATTVEIAPPRAQTEEEIIREVEADLLAMKTYLVDAIFWAAGLMEFRVQEIERLRDRFVRARGVWQGVAQNEQVEGNAQLLAALPPDLKASEFDVQIAERLRQLRLALDEVRA